MGAKWWLTVILIYIILITKMSIPSLVYWPVMFPFLWNAGLILLLILLIWYHFIGNETALAWEKRLHECPKVR